MSQENVEVMLGAIEAFNREDLEALAQICDEEFEFVSVLTAVDAGGATYRGAHAWTSYFERMRESWSDWRVEDVRVFDVDDARLAVLFRLVGTGKNSGVPVEREVGAAYTFRQGKLLRMRSYAEPAEALEAVGLSE